MSVRDLFVYAIGIYIFNMYIGLGFYIYIDVELKYNSDGWSVTAAGWFYVYKLVTVIFTLFISQVGTIGKVVYQTQTPNGWLYREGGRVYI